MGMNRIEITLLKPQAALDAFADTWRRTERGEQQPSQLVFTSLRELFSAITEKRLELLRYVVTHENLSIRQLAQGLERDYKNVHTDVTELIGLGLIEKNARGRLSAPFDEIVIRAGLRDAA
jgi:predicted transcriptional regulator